MVNDGGQLYTMEGVAAGVIMLLTAYIVISTTSVYTPGDTHIPDMQLEQLGSDVLAMMDTPDADGSESQLTTLVQGGVPDGEILREQFLDYCKMRAGSDDNDLRAQVYLSYRTTSGSVNTTPLSLLDPEFTGRENTVRVTRWVHLNENPPGNPPGIPSDIGPFRPRTVLLEVLLWRA
ncbi:MULTISPECIES: DUF7288 family protein [Methanoculleus]|uniref:Uncharacterized protein n=2 Tax=Methanoculleus TaxID=45989 RepID=A3CY47_METMJ|nr:MULTISPECIES: hypothetical protein [Methanoculleus]ABN58297.1 hypothetical protein Memar_2374 [Methanoculleus marisnigri JR1]MCC7554536.1 hypothetical protein [Methanoculleus marisnigri]UYU19670.1 hypothetical protein OH143_06140 [Methanoculleus submarinus]